MQNFYNNMVSFFAIWFNDIKKHVFKVQVVNRDDSISKKLTDLSDVIKTQLSKTLLVAVSNQKELNTLGIEKKITEISSIVKNIKPQDLTRVEKLLNELISSVSNIPQPKLPEIKIPQTKFPDRIEISNFPKKQEISGSVDVDFKKVIDGLQVVVDAINDLKLETSQGLSSVSNVYAGQTGSRGSVKITDGTDTVGITDEALDVNIKSSEPLDIDTTGLATSANQTTGNSSLASIKTAVEILDNIVSGSEAQVDIVGSLPSGTNAIGKLAANNGVDIGDVDVASIAAGDNNIGNVDIASIAAGNNNIGDVDVASIAAGNNNIGDVDIASITNGSLNGPGAPSIASYTHAAINLNAGANQVLASSAANRQIWVYGLGFTVNAAGTVSFQDEDDTAVSGIMNIAASSGMVIAPSGNFAMPIWKLGTDKDLEVDVVTSELDGWIDYALVIV